MQKLLTIYLDNTAYGKPKTIGCYSEKHGFIEEHVQDYLNDGWRIVDLGGFGGGNPPCSQGWLSVVLEKDG